MTDASGFVRMLRAERFRTLGESSGRDDGQDRTDSSLSEVAGPAESDSVEFLLASMRLPTSMTIGSTDTATMSRKIRSILSRTTAIWPSR